MFILRRIVMRRLIFIFFLICSIDVRAMESISLDDARNIAKRILKRPTNMKHIKDRHTFSSHSEKASYFNTDDQNVIKSIIAETVEKATKVSFERDGNQKPIEMVLERFFANGFGTIVPIGRDHTGYGIRRTVKVCFNIKDINVLNDANTKGYLTTAFPIEP